MGHRLKAQGVCPDPAKVKAIAEMLKPVGLCNISFTFFPKRYEIPDREECIVHMATYHDEALATVKRLTMVSIFIYYDVNEATTKQCGQKALGIPYCRKVNLRHLCSEASQ